MKKQHESHPREGIARMEREKKPYQKPVLTKHGDIRTHTLAPSPVPTIETGGGVGDFGRFILPGG